jgi:hypothetical protein
MGTWRPLVFALAVGMAAGACSDDDDGGGAAAPGTDAPAATTTTAAPRGTDVAAPTSVDGPIEGGEYGVPYNPMPDGLAEEHGYTEEEWFISGEATSYVAGAPLAEDGVWDVQPGENAAYTTRILVRRPAEDADFSGTVVVEWLNVSAGRDSDPDFGFLHPDLLADGDAYVGVSAQATGVQGGGAVLEVPGVPEVALLPLQAWDPERYADLDHPGDPFSYDIYSQVAALLRRPGEVDPLHGLRPEHVVAVGESQSAGRLATYVNAVHPVADIYDGFLVHSRGDGAAALNEDPADATPEPALLRTDLEDPVLQFETETDLVGLGHLAARQDDTDTVMTWEVAGTAHADASTLDYGRASGQVWLPNSNADPTADCGTINDGPQPEVVRAAFAALEAWIVDGSVPPASPRIESTADDLVRDDVGNVVGGIRTPAVDAPIAALTGVNPSDSVFCSLFGAAEPLTEEQLAELYTDHDDYVAQVTTSADAAVEGGFLLPEDRDVLVAEAESADVP